MNFTNEKNLPFLRSAAQALQEENARLRAEHGAVLAMREEALAALEEKAMLETRLCSLEEVAARQQSEITRLAQENQALKEQLDRRNRALFGRKSERRPVEEAGQETPDEQKPPRKKHPGHGHTPQPKLPRVKVVNELTGDALSCEHCGGTMELMGSAAEEAELIAIEERKIVLEQHIRAKYQCPCCRIGVKIAPGSLKLIPGGRYALSFAVEVAYSKYFAHLPLDRQVQMMKHEGLRVTTSALFDQIDALATALAPTYQAILRIVQAEVVLRADETPWAVLSNGHTKNERFYAWVAVGTKYLAYCLLDTRSKDGAATILGSFAGTLMVDGLTSYPAAAKSEAGAPPKFKVANCWVHARRGFVECEKHYPEESGFIMELVRQLYEVEREGKEPDANLGSLRNERSRPLVDQIFAWAKDQQKRTDLLPSSGLMKALNYLVNNETGLRVFLDDPAVPIDNNESERALRGPVLGRKNSYGSRSRRGTETAAILYTLVESAKRVDVNPRAYLEAAAEFALTRAGAILLPDEFKRQLDAVRESPANSA